MLVVQYMVFSILIGGMVGQSVCRLNVTSVNNTLAVAAFLDGVWLAVSMFVAIQGLPSMSMDLTAVLWSHDHQYHLDRYRLHTVGCTPGYRFRFLRCWRRP